LQFLQKEHDKKYAAIGFQKLPELRGLKNRESYLCETYLFAIFITRFFCFDYEQ